MREPHQGGQGVWEPNWSLSWHHKTLQESLVLTSIQTSQEPDLPGPIAVLSFPPDQRERTIDHL